MSNKEKGTEDHDPDLEKPLDKHPDADLTHVTTHPRPFVFTIYTAKERYVLMMIPALVGWWSTVSSPIWFPALPTISKEFNVSSSLADISVVAYLLFQGLAPTFSSNIADTFGKRPVIIACLVAYIATCIALSQTNVYWLLTVLRCVQAAAIGPVIAISSGISGDVCTAADRGGFVGIVSGMQLTGNAFGGLIGAALIERFGWRGIFIFLAIGCGVSTVFIAFALPETSRLIVGNGTVKPKNWLNFAPIFLLKHYRKRLTNETESLSPKKKLDFLAPFKMILSINICCILFPLALKFAIWTMALTSINALEGDGYHYTVMKVGYIYLPQGVACFFGSMLSGKLLDRSYRISKKRFDTKYQDVPESERPKFNVLKTRVWVCVLPCIIFCFGCIIFGWCLEYKQNISSIIISTSMISYASTSAISIGSTILVDMNPKSPSTSVSLVNLVRCLLAALGAGVISRMTTALKLGPTYTFWGGISLLSDLLLVYAVWWRKPHLHK